MLSIVIACTLAYLRNDDDCYHGYHMQSIVIAFTQAYQRNDGDS